MVRNIPFLRGLTYATPPYHAGTIIENRAGLQLFRTVSKFLLWKSRRRFVTDEIKNYVQIMERDGILVIENFLPENHFSEVSAEFEKANQSVRLAPYKGDADASLYRTQIAAAQSPENFTAIIEHFQENELLQKIAAAVIRRKITKPPEIFLDTYQKLNDRGFDNDIENILHADLHTSTVKMFFYLNDVDEQNGAFVYAKGSHKLTRQRLKYEYELSIRQAQMKRGVKIQDEFLARRGSETRNTITAEQLDNMKAKETQIRARPNTLVVANNMGFHRRGEFTCDRPRKALMINFRNSEKSVG